MGKYYRWKKSNAVANTSYKANQISTLSAVIEASVGDVLYETSLGTASANGFSKTGSLTYTDPNNYNDFYGKYLLVKNYRKQPRGAYKVQPCRARTCPYKTGSTGR